jgi:hypothetical protein
MAILNYVYACMSMTCGCETCDLLDVLICDELWICVDANVVYVYWIFCIVNMWM